MNLKTTFYKDYVNHLPQTGNHILAQQKSNSLIVYQAFNPRIAKYAVDHQQFGGPHYSFSRMSWIKPNFLWMMYRCGWAKKENQKRVLAIEISKDHFEEILAQAVHSSFKSELYKAREQWQFDLEHSEVRIQWDPDHNPNGEKLDRRAIQLGLKGKVLSKFGKDWVQSIQDITDFVLEQGEKVEQKKIDELEVIKEAVYEVKMASTKEYLMIY